VRSAAAIAGYLPVQSARYRSASGHHRERGQKVPSILVMGQIATALDTSIGRLIDE
jgi:hypothetical protein